jgi:CheY-like chemotaxis protein
MMNCIFAETPPIVGCYLDQPLVLVVEDDPTLRDLLKDILTEEASYQVIVASCGQIALQQLALLMAKQHVPDLMLIDYQIGRGMTGIDLYDQLQASPELTAIPTLLMSANLPRELIEARGLKSLPKPFEVGDLLRVVEEMLGCSEVLREEMV